MSTKSTKSIRQLAKASGYSVGEVQRRRARGETDPQIMAAAERRTEKRRNTPEKRTTESYADAQARKERALADLREIEAARARREYVNLSEVKRGLIGLIIASKTRLLAMGAKLAPELAVETEAGKCQKLVDDEVYEALTELSRWEPASVVDPPES
jgi:hypothetical protein